MLILKEANHAHVRTWIDKMDSQLLNPIKSEFTEITGEWSNEDFISFVYDNPSYVADKCNTENPDVFKKFLKREKLWVSDEWYVSLDTTFRDDVLHLLKKFGISIYSLSIDGNTVISSKNDWVKYKDVAKVCDPISYMMVEMKSLKPYMRDTLNSNLNRVFEFDFKILA